jgi:hypothetical protein
MSIQATHGNPSVHQAQSNRPPQPASQPPASSSPIPQDKVTISPEAKARAAGITNEHGGETK